MNCKTFLIDQDQSDCSRGRVLRKISCRVCLRTGQSVSRCTKVSLSSSQNLQHIEILGSTLFWCAPGKLGLVIALIRRVRLLLDSLRMPLALFLSGLSMNFFECLWSMTLSQYSVHFLLKCVSICAFRKPQGAACYKLVLGRLHLL